MSYAKLWNPTQTSVSLSDGTLISPNGIISTSLGLYREICKENDLDALGLEVAFLDDLFPLNVKDFGAYGNGVMDDFSYLNEAIWVARKKSLQVILPSGIYRVGDTIKLGDNISLTSNGRDKTLVVSQCSPTFIIESNCEIRGLTLTGEPMFHVEQNATLWISDCILNGYEKCKNEGEIIGSGNMYL